MIQLHVEKRGTKIWFPMRENKYHRNQAEPIATTIRHNIRTPGEQAVTEFSAEWRAS